MTVRASVSFTDQNHAYAEELVARGEFGSVSAVVAAGIQALRERAEERQIALDVMADEIRRRAETSRDDFTDFDAEAERAHFRERAEMRRTARSAAE